MISHQIKRTSQKGDPFLGICVKCKKRNLSILDASKKCEVGTALKVIATETCWFCGSGDSKGRIMLTPTRSIDCSICKKRNHAIEVLKQAIASVPEPEEGK